MNTIKAKDLKPGMTVKVLDMPAQVSAITHHRNRVQITFYDVLTLIHFTIAQRKNKEYEVIK